MLIIQKINKNQNFYYVSLIQFFLIKNIKIKLMIKIDNIYLRILSNIIVKNMIVMICLIYSKNIS